MSDKDTYTSPDMVKFSQVINIISTRGSSFKDEKKLAEMIAAINGLPKYDLKPVADNITNNNTTVNLIAESGKVKELIDKMKDRF